MVVVFVVCWIPINALTIYNDIKTDDPDFGPPYYFDVIFVSSHIIAMSSAVYNPLLYAWLSETFRRNLRSMVPRWNLKSIGFCATAGAPVILEDTVSPSTQGAANELSRRNIELQTHSGIGVDGGSEASPDIHVDQSDQEIRN